MLAITSAMTSDDELLSRRRTTTSAVPGPQEGGKSARVGAGQAAVPRRRWVGLALRGLGPLGRPGGGAPSWSTGGETTAVAVDAYGNRSA